MEKAVTSAFEGISLFSLWLILSNDAVKTKNVETFVSSFFVYRHRSKVIFRVTQKALRDFLSYLRKYLALAGGSDHAKDKSVNPEIYPLLQNPLPVVACFEVTSAAFCSAPGGHKTMDCGDKPALHLPVVASITSCRGASKHPEGFHNLKYTYYDYGK